MHPEVVKAALGMEPVDVAFRNALLFNPFLAEWVACSFGVSGGIVTGTGEYRGRTEVDLHGARVIPGLIDAHVHIESSLITPGEYARLALTHGTTTVIADPHEIANVLGSAGITWMLDACRDLSLDVFFMLPSCVPSDAEDQGGAVLHAEDLAPFLACPQVIGLGEMMNVPGVLDLDGDVWAKLALAPLVDGHAPHLGGNALAAYLQGGIQSDHESTDYAEAREKLAQGMYIYLREGSTERSIGVLAPLLTPAQISRCCFATDDRHADLLTRGGGVDDCIRTAVDAGAELETALQAATLSAAERFRLTDRGAIVPGRIADFCILGDRDLTVKATFKRGQRAESLPLPPPACPDHPFRCRLPALADLAIGDSGEAWIITLEEGAITTGKRRVQVCGADLPDPGRDLLKAVAVDRYRGSGWGIALVQGFGFQEGAIASSVAHDAHNLIAVGADDRAIIAALGNVARMGGGMVAVDASRSTSLALPCAGLMSPGRAEEVVGELDALSAHVHQLGGKQDAFMYASFLSLPVIPRVRITPRGLFDVAARRHIGLFAD